MTPAAQLAEVERLIEELRGWARSEPESLEGRAYRALRSHASDLRGRLPEAAPAALAALERRIEHARRSKTRLGYNGNHLRGLGEELIGRWPAVRWALEMAENTEQVR